MSAGTMYPALQQMEDEGMIVSETKDGKRVYQLTELGREELQRESATAEDIWRRTSDWGDWGEWIIGSPLGPLMRAMFRAMRYATGEPERFISNTFVVRKSRLTCDRSHGETERA